MNTATQNYAMYIRLDRLPVGCLTAFMAVKNLRLVGEQLPFLRFFKFTANDKTRTGGTSIVDAITLVAYVDLYSRPSF